jgi:hypothetical protein
MMKGDREPVSSRGGMVSLFGNWRRDESLNCDDVPLMFLNTTEDKDKGGQ